MRKLSQFTPNKWAFRVNDSLLTRRTRQRQTLSTNWRVLKLHIALNPEGMAACSRGRKPMESKTIYAKALKGRQQCFMTTNAVVPSGLELVRIP